MTVEQTPSENTSRVPKPEEVAATVMIDGQPIVVTGTQIKASDGTVFLVVRSEGIQPSPEDETLIADVVQLVMQTGRPTAVDF